VQVIAIDQSESQIEQALNLSNVQYGVARAEDTGLPESSVDLVTVAQALHWYFHYALAASAF
jgi:ubiquinone/menaquinone biosynthesis C-methylase UbiE